MLLSLAIFSLSTLVQGQLKILLPESLAQSPDLEDGVIYGTTSVVGTPEYGRRVMGTLVYKEPLNLETPHCEPSEFPVHTESDEDEDTKKEFAIVLRGGCSFVKKVRLAQKNGMSGVIVVDDSCEKQHEAGNLICRDSEAVQRIIMADDGTGDDIKIPSVLIPARQGELLIDSVKNAGPTAPVISMLLWDLPRTSHVSFNFWMSTGAGDAMAFMASMRPVIAALGSKIDFTPHFNIVDAGTRQLSNSCLKVNVRGVEKYFCDPTVSKSEVVKEDLRQLCIWNRYKTEAENKVTLAPEYWNYVEKFVTTCHPSVTKTATTFTEECSNNVISYLGLDSEAIDYCMTSFRPPECRNEESPVCSRNLIVEQAKQRAWSPHAIRINGWRYSGPLDSNAVARQICAAFSTWPDECETAVIDKAPAVHHDQGVTLNALVFLLFFIGVGLSFLIYRRLIKKRMYSTLREEVMLEVRAQMQDYTMLVEHGETPIKSNSRGIELSAIPGG